MLAIDERTPGKERLRVVLKALTGTVITSDFGSPVIGSTRYDVCIYNQANALVADLTIDRAQQLCGTKPCWRTINTPGYSYKDAIASADGTKSIVAKSGTGTGRLVVRGANRSIFGQTALPTGIAAALQAPNAQATAQVLTSDARCFDAVLSTIAKNTAQQFTGRKP